MQRKLMWLPLSASDSFSASRIVMPTWKRRRICNESDGVARRRCHRTRESTVAEIHAKDIGIAGFHLTHEHQEFSIRRHRRLQGRRIEQLDSRPGSICADRTNGLTALVDDVLRVRRPYRRRIDGGVKCEAAL